jgi:hypothetical protein
MPHPHHIPCMSASNMRTTRGRSSPVTSAINRSILRRNCAGGAPPRARRVRQDPPASPWPAGTKGQLNEIPFLAVLTTNYDGMRSLRIRARGIGTPVIVFAERGVFQKRKRQALELGALGCYYCGGLRRGAVAHVPHIFMRDGRRTITRSSSAPLRGSCRRLPDYRTRLIQKAEAGPAVGREAQHRPQRAPLVIERQPRPPIRGHAQSHACGARGVPDT